MKITGIELDSVRGFAYLEHTNLSRKINIFIGPNNAGKSTILNSIFQLQRRVLTDQDVSIGKENGIIKIFFEGNHLNYIRKNILNQNHILLELNGSKTYLSSDGERTHSIGKIPEQEPENLIYPYLSKRKASGYTDTINELNANSVTGTLVNLYSKIDRLITPQFQPGNKLYVEACESILGFQISTIPKGGGKQAVYYIRNLEHISLTSMGEGVPNLLGLICDLCIAENKIFLIEEPENDIHPKALKALLKLIIEKSESNQFFISTHSNIVMKYLGSSPDSKLFHINSQKGKVADKPNLYQSSLREISDSAEERRQVLEDLGYDFFDFDMWSAWLFLEESSAETIIKLYLIPWFIKPIQGKIRTFAAGGVSEIEPKFEDFNRLFVFLHLEPTYKNKVWVLIDSGTEEDTIIERMRNTYSLSGWEAANFLQFKQHDFEMYYPKRFQDEVNKVIKITNKTVKRAAKKALLQKVKNWIEEEPEVAKEEFKESASEVIEKLKIIAKSINK